MRTSWEECLPTGWEPFDEEHRGMVRCLGEILSAVNANDAPRACASVQELLRVAGEHFAHEERMMRANAYPQLSRHKEAHDLYLADVAEFAAQVASKGLTREFRSWSTGRVLEWFRFHVSANDVALGAFLVARQRACQLSDGGAEVPKAR
ncbi:MAG TPA: hemerythrin family protein [Anaeromyxobacter sp.]